VVKRRDLVRLNVTDQGNVKKKKGVVYRRDTEKNPSSNKSWFIEKGELVQLDAQKRGGRKRMKYSIRKLKTTGGNIQKEGPTQKGGDTRKTKLLKKEKLLWGVKKIRAELPKIRKKRLALDSGVWKGELATGGAGDTVGQSSSQHQLLKGKEKKNLEGEGDKASPPKTIRSKTAVWRSFLIKGEAFLPLKSSSVRQGKSHGRALGPSNVPGCQGSKG